MLNKNFFLYKILNVFRKEWKIVALLFFLIFIYTTNILFTAEGNLKNENLIRDIETEIQIALSNISIFEEFNKDIFLKWAIVVFSVIAILLLVGGLLIDMYYIFFKKKFKLTQVKSISNSEWTLKDIFKILIIIFSAGYGFAIFINIIFKFLNINIKSNIVNPIVFSTFFHVIAVVCIFYYIKLKYDSGFDSLGLNFSKSAKSILIGILSYSSIIPAIILVLLTSIVIFYYIGYETEPNAIFLVYFLPVKIPKLIYLLIFISVIGPICEEIFFRGFIYKFLRSKLGITSGILLTSVIFSFLHLTPVGFIPIFVLSIMLSYIYEKTGSLVAPITAHVLHNSMISFFMLILRKMIY